MSNIDDIITEHRRRLKILLENQDQIRGLGDTDGEIDFGQQQIKISTDITIDGNQVASNLIGTKEARQILTDILSGDNSQSPSKHVVGSGSSSQPRRETNSLSSKISPNAESTTITDNGDTLTVSSSIDIKKTKEVKEVGLETNNNNLLQYIDNL